MNFWRFNNDNPALGMAIQGSYDPIMVGLSIIIACFAGITTLALADRMTASPSRSAKAWWQLGGAVALGFGIWSMHFTGMLAFKLPDHPEIQYDTGLTLISLIPAMAGSMAALYFIAQTSTQGLRLQLCSLALAIGIATMHYTGMEAMKMPGLRYDFTLFVTSIVVAHLLAMTALSVRAYLRAKKRLPENVVNYISGAIIGISVAGTHYTAMEAARFYAIDDGHTVHSVVSNADLAASIGLFAGVILGLSIIAAWIDRQVGFQRLLNLEKMAHTDALTGLPNRVLYESQLEEALEKNQRQGDNLALMYFDLNKFKPINDTYGHAAGDLLLREFGSRLKSCLRERDLAARLGGDEFAALLRGFSKLEDVALVAERILDSLAQPVRINRLELHLSVSIGISLCPDDAQTKDELIQMADEAMYRAKAGKLGYCFAGYQLSRLSEEYQHVAATITQALENSEITLLYQPILDIQTGKIIAVEAFSRFPNQHTQSPLEFFELAERRGKTRELSDLVLRAVCRQASQWQKDGIEFGRICVNISDTQTRHPDFFKCLLGIMQQFSVPGKRLELELSASCFKSPNDAIRSQIIAAKARGVTITLDEADADALQAISEYPLQKVKISRRLIAESANSTKARALIKTIATLSLELGYELTCGGIETEEQLRRATEVGCSSGQGYFFYRPMTADLIASKLAALASTHLKNEQ